MFVDSRDGALRAALAAAMTIATPLAGCHGDSSASGPDGAPPVDASAAADAAPPDLVVGHHFCDLPGSLQFTANGTVTVPGAPSTDPGLGFLHLPTGFCAHYYASVGNAREIRFAPGGELFVASPTAAGNGGLGAFVALPDYDHDGRADETATFLAFASPGTTNQGMLFANGYFYYQDGIPPGTKILRLPYKTGDLQAAGSGDEVANITIYSSSLHWPKSIDLADDGTIYVANGGDQTEICDPTHPFHGGILSIDAAPGGPSPGGVPVARGLRYSVGVRCARDTTAASRSSRPRTSPTAPEVATSCSRSTRATTGDFPAAPRRDCRTWVRRRAPTALPWRPRPTPSSSPTRQPVWTSSPASGACPGAVPPTSRSPARPGRGRARGWSPFQ
jgi:hypothetical protein